MNCDEVRKILPGMLYGEMSFEEEDDVQTHVDSCAACRRELDLQKALERALDRRELDVSPFLLRQCRQQLQSSLEHERTHTSSWRRYWLAVSDSFSGAFAPRILKPMGALGLLALGFLGARFTPSFLGGTNTMGVFDPATARVRYVEPGKGGEIQLVVDESRQRVVTGRLDDDRIRRLLVAASKDSTDPGLRGESVEILKSKSDVDEIRDALLHALQHDANSGVRLRALSALKAYASQPDVRKALSLVLLSDTNPGVRTQAIDLLTQNAKTHELVPVLQELLRKEDNGYIRLKGQQTLREMKASEESY